MQGNINVIKILDITKTLLQGWNGMDWILYFTWSLRKQAAYKQATRGPMALSPFQGTRQ